MGTQSDICDQRYWTEPDIGTSDIGMKSTESDIISDIGIKFGGYPISKKKYLIPCSAVVRCQLLCLKVEGSKPKRKMKCQIILLGSLGNDLSILDIGMYDIDLVRYQNGS